MTREPGVTALEALVLKEDHLLSARSTPISREEIASLYPPVSLGTVGFSRVAEQRRLNAHVSPRPDFAGRVGHNTVCNSP